MTDKKTSAESAAATLDGTELVRAVQSAANVQTTTQAIRDLAPSKGVTVLAASAVESAVHTGDTVLTTLATIAVAGNTLGANGRLRITALFKFTGTAGAKTPVISFGGSTFFNTASGATDLSARLQIEITNRNATNSQVANPNVAGVWGFSTTAVTTAAIDTTASQNILLRGQLANAGDSIAVESYLVEVIRP